MDPASTPIAQLQLLLDLLPAHAAVLAPDSTILAVNRAWRSFGEANGLRLPAGGVGTRYLEACNLEGDGAEHARAAAAALQRVLSGAEAEGYLEYPCPTPEAPRWFGLRVVRVPCAGAPLALALHEDVTAREALRGERDRLAGELRAGRALLQSLLQHIPSGVVVAEAPSGRLLLANEQAEELLVRRFHPGRALSEYSTRDLYHPDGRPFRHGELPLVRALRQGEVVHEEPIHLRLPSGERRPLLASAAPVQDEAGQTFAALLVLADPAGQLLAQRRLQEAEARFHTLSDHLEIGVGLVDARGRCVRGNPALFRILGYTDGDLADLIFTDITHPEDAEADWTFFQELMRGERDSYRMEKRFFRADGRIVYGRLTAVAVRTTDGEPPRYALGLVEPIPRHRPAA